MTAIATLAQDHRAGLSDHGRTLWQLLMLETSLQRLFGLGAIKGCGDKAIAAIRRGEEPGKELSAENMFGASTGIARPTADEDAVKREELRQIIGTVTSLRNADDGMIILELDNGQVWRQQDSNVRLMVSKGDTVTVVRASLGTFRITDKTGRFARFKRVR